MRSVIALVVVATALAGCTRSKPAHGAPCVSLCTGRIDGAEYSILMPRSWNGTLLLYSHGYRSPAPAGPGSPILAQTDTKGDRSDDVSRALLAKGYALAGSSYASGGWVVPNAITSARQLHARFVELVGRPKRVYVWGSSLGGLVSELLAERETWVDGAAPLCGVVAGPNLMFDNLMEATTAVKALFAPELQLSGYSSLAQARAQAALVGRAITTAVDGGKNSAPDKVAPAKVMYIGALAGIPRRSQSYAGDTETSLIHATAQALIQYVQVGITTRFDVERRFGGDPSASQAAQLTPGDAAAVTALGGDVGAFAGALSEVSATVDAHEVARTAFERSGTPTGDIRVPTLTMHTEYDPVALTAQETVLRSRVAAAKRASNLLQIFIGPPSHYDPKVGPLSGVSHCFFTNQQLIGVVDALDGWIRGATPPSADDLTRDIGPGLDLSFTPKPWPGGATR